VAKAATRARTAFIFDGVGDCVARAYREIKKYLKEKKKRIVIYWF
jgi:hypothetical protein